MSVRATNWAWEEGRRHALTQGQRLVLVRLADHADHDGVCWPGIARVADYAGCNESTIRRALARFEGLGLMHRTRAASGAGRGRKNDTIHLHVDDDQPGKMHGRSEDDQPGKTDGLTGQSTDDQPGNDDAPYIEEPSGTVRESSGGARKRARGSSDDIGTEFEQWLDHYRRTTGRPAKGAAGARVAFRARRREKWTLDQLMLATEGCTADRWRRDRGHDVPDTILRKSNVEGYYLEGRKLRGEADGVRVVDGADLDPSDEAIELWAETVAVLRSKLPDAMTTIGGIEVVSLEAGKLTLAMPAGQLGHTTKRYGRAISSAIAEASGTVGDRQGGGHRRQPTVAFVKLRRP